MKIVQLDEKAVNEFCRLRIQLFEELGEISKKSDLSELKMKTHQYYLSHVNKDLFSWGIFQGDRLIAIGSLCLFTRIPYKENLNGLEGYILNIYTVPEARKNGYANQILNAIIEFSQKNNINRLWLNSSEQARHLYLEKGFTDKENEMELFL